MLANTKNGNWRSQQPSQTVTYASCHDNQTLWDRLCDSQNLSDYFRVRHPLIVSENKLVGGMLAMSQGVTFMLAGEEMGRSKDNDENSYSSPATLNMIDWSQVSTNADIVSYYKGMLSIRKAFSPLYDDTKASSEKYKIYSGYKNPTAVYAGVWENDTEGEWHKLAVIANAASTEKEFSLEELDGVKDWVVIANNMQAGVSKISENGKKFTLPAKSMIVAVDKESFESTPVTDSKGYVNVKNVNVVTGKVIDSYTISGTIGSKYSISIPTGIDKSFELKGITGDMNGEFTEGAKDVVLNYGYYVPESCKADINGDDKSNISDATFMQKALAHAVEITSTQAQLSDITCDGVFDINDVTMYQRNLAKMNVATGKVVVNYINKATGDPIIDPVEYTGRVGETYKPRKASILGYAVDENMLPQESVTVPYGVKEVSFYYVEAESNVTIHIKHSGAKTWDPSLWIWGMADGDNTGKQYNDKKSWPGVTLTEKDAKGWYSKSFTADRGDDSYGIVVSDGGSPQSMDCTGFTQNELWIVIDDEKAGLNLRVYEVNPDDNPDAEPFFTTY